MKDKTALIEERHPMKAYKWGQLTFVPHYDGTGFYVGPGYPRHTTMKWREEDLQAIGAREVTEFLWSRPRFAKAA